MGIMQQQFSDALLEEMKRNDYLRENIIYLDEEVDRHSQIKFCRQLKKLAEKELGKKEEERKPIKIIISSYGGVVYDFFAMASMMEYYQEKGIIIETHCQGYVASASCKLLACGSKGHRYITRYAYVLAHQIQTGQWGNMTLQERIADAEQLQKEWGIIKQFFKKHTKLTDEEIEAMTKYNLDVCYNAEEAVEKGFADIIL